MAWRLAGSLVVLFDEVNRAAPNRSKASDGTIGDEAHATRDSDHNPYIIDSNGMGVVRAANITHDPGSGCNCRIIAERARKLGANGDPRIRYVIFEGKIASASSSPAWAWRPYGGSNGHYMHVHVSVSESSRGYDDRRPWGVYELLRGEDDMAGFTEDQKDFLRNFAIGGLKRQKGKPLDDGDGEVRRAGYGAVQLADEAGPVSNFGKGMQEAGTGERGEYKEAGKRVMATSGELPEEPPSP
jgi:hypothetical protein